MEVVENAIVCWGIIGIAKHASHFYQNTLPNVPARESVRKHAV